ncbi:hypothetical protein ACFL5L_04470 [candidate division KSB1 bacterium]
MDKIAVDYKDQGVEFWNLYTREPHPGQNTDRSGNDPRLDFTNIPQTKTMDEREDYALKMIMEWNQTRPIMVDIFPDQEKGIKTVQQWLGGGAPNSLAIIDREGNLFFWQQWAQPTDAREKLEELLKSEKN